MVTTSSPSSSVIAGNASAPAYSPGLEGVIAGTTSICTIEPEKQTLTYRGYDIKDLIGKASFEEVAYLLLYGELPSAAQLVEFKQTLAANRAIPEPVTQMLQQFPKSNHPMDHLKAGAALLALYDPETGDNSNEANLRKAIRLIAQTPTLVAYSHRLRNGQPLIAPQDGGYTHAENFLYMVFGQKPTPAVTKVFDATLVIYAEHSFNASTFSARVTTSTLSDIHSGITAAIGALKGPLHGGANEQAMLTFLEVQTPEKAEQWTLEALAQKRKIMGFGHRAYKNGDPRATILKAMRGELLEELAAQGKGNAPWPQIADTMEDIVLREKGLYPNVDYPIAYMYYLMDLPTPIYTPIFAVGRMAGWTAHVVEQLANNRLIRPKALYEGPAYRSYVPLETR